MASRPVLVNRQFNSPVKLYSAENVADTLNKQTQILANGALGIDFHHLKAPGNLANSAVLRMLEEENERAGKENNCIEQSKPRRRIQRFDWPPKPPIRDADNHDNDENNNINNNFNDKVMHNDWKQRHHFNTTTYNITTSPGLKRVAWPPLPETQISNLVEKQLVYSQEPAIINTPTSPNTPNKQQNRWAPNNTQTHNPQQQQQQVIEPYYEQQQIIEPYYEKQAPEPVFQRIVQAPAPVFEPPPTFVTLRRTAPVSQVNAPVYAAQPAATHGQGGTRMRGDQKWPPAEQKAQAVAENEARQALAKGPAVRPRKVKKDYTQFFAANAITTTYPGYRAPPGTQHYVEEGTSNF